MTIKDSAQYKQLKDALEALNELSVPENLQKTALEHLLWQKPRSVNPPLNPPMIEAGEGLLPAVPASSLRSFIAEMKPKGAVAEIPCLLYWSKMQENVEFLDEKGIVDLYRRAGLRPPKNVAQSFRDLSSKKYGRLESAPGKNGHVGLSRVGEDFVLHDVKGTS